MNILLAGKHVPTGNTPIGGVQSWIATVATELRRRGHRVTIWESGPLKGLFDIGIFAHLKYTRPALRLCRRTINVTHGIIPDEKPEPGCDVTVAVSEGVQEHWSSGVVVRQPIDLRFWRDEQLDRKWLTRFSYRKTDVNLDRIGQALGLPVQHISDASPEDARKALSESACVLASGRAALEAMACGAPTVIYDNREYQGILLGPESLLVSMKHSYSGRGGYRAGPDAVIADCRRVMKAIGSQRLHVQKHHDAEDIVTEILCLIC